MILRFNASAIAADLPPIAANGRLEGANPTAELRFAESGRIAEVHVLEGQTVKKGDLLASLECSALKAELRHAQSLLAIAARGGRKESVATRAAAVAALDAEARRYKAQVRRLESLSARKLVAESALEDALLQLQATEAQRVVAEKQYIETRNPLPKEEQIVAGAHADALSARLRECSITAPTDGLILRRLLEPGAAISSLFPEPVILFASSGAWNVRAEVDEHDILRVRPGQRAIVTAPGFGDSSVSGTVVTMSSLMGRRTVLSGDPGEKLDRDVREVIVRIDGQPPLLVVGLRVKVRFLGKPALDGQRAARK